MPPMPTSSAARVVRKVSTFTNAAPLVQTPAPAPVQSPTNPLLSNSAGLAAPTPAASTNTGPKIVFKTPIYDFGRVKSGDPVKYTYIFTNIGDQVLEINNVQPQCGCTAAGEFTRKVEAGQTGEIPIQFNTSSYGTQVIKTITVASNDKSQPVVVLQLKGTVWKPIELIPPYTIMNILPDAPNATGVVRIVNNMEFPLSLTEPVCSNPAFTVALRTNTAGKEYQLTLTAVPPLAPGTIQGKVTLKTSATNTPVIDVPFWANVQASVMVLPPQIMIPATLPTKVSPGVTIQNNSTNALVVSDPVFNMPGPEAQIRELQPGRIFSVQVTLPPGFEIPVGKKAILTLKTSHPKYQTLEVPIVQMPKPVTALQNVRRPMPGAPGLNRTVVKPPTFTPAAGSQTNQDAGRPVQTTGKPSQP